jgi:ribosomal protein L28
MSYRCQVCGVKVPVGTKAMHKVFGTRARYYPYRAKANKGFQTKNGRVLQPLRKSRKQGDRIDDPGGKGWEIAKEILVCSECSSEESGNA